jgi:hypothetical protein
VSNGFQILDTQGTSATLIVSLAAARRCSIAASIRSITGT